MAPKITIPMWISAMLWKWPTTHSVLCATTSYWIVASPTPCRPATSHETSATDRNRAAGLVQSKADR